MTDAPDRPPDVPPQARWLPAQGERPAGWYISAGGNVGRTVASLRFFGEDLNADEITRLLGCDPTRTHRKGDPVTKDGRGCRRQSAWALESSLPGTSCLDEHVAHLLSRVSDNPAVWSALAGFSPDIFCGLFLSDFNQGDTISPTTAALLAARGLPLALDIYAP